MVCNSAKCKLHAMQFMYSVLCSGKSVQCSVLACYSVHCSPNSVQWCAKQCKMCVILCKICAMQCKLCYNINVMQSVGCAVQKVCFAMGKVCYAGKVWTSKVYSAVHWSGRFAAGSAQEDYLPLSGPLLEPCQPRLGPTFKRFEHFNDFLLSFERFPAIV